jgi:hypothetical protein
MTDIEARNAELARWLKKLALLAVAAADQLPRGRPCQRDLAKVLRRAADRAFDILKS